MRAEEVREAISELLRTHTNVTSGALAAHLGISRQNAHQHLAREVKEGWLIRRGAGRAVRYLRASYEQRFSLANLDEEKVWLAIVPRLSEWVKWTVVARNRAHYAVTEIVNNAIDHSEGSFVRVATQLVDSAHGVRLEVVVEDDGVGAFAKAGQGLDQMHTAEIIVELSKGKRTTAPEAHSGEGLFFTSKVATWFRVEANGFAWVVDNELNDEGILIADIHQGTRVTVLVDPFADAPLEEVFSRFTRDFQFTKSRVRIRLLEFGDALISRSQGKRLCSRLEDFEEVELDFSGVVGVGQGFVDEVFRVWARGHPQTVLVPTHMNEAVHFMVERGLWMGGTKVG